MEFKLNIRFKTKRLKAVSLFETILSLSLIMLAFGILFQTFVWSKGVQYEQIRQRIEKRNIFYETLINKQKPVQIN